MSTLKADTIQSTGGGAATLTRQSAAKVYARMSSSAVTQSLNTSGFTDNGTGDYTVAFTNAFTNATFAGTTSGLGTAARAVNYSNSQTTSLDVDTFASSTGSRVDAATGINVHGDLA